jgi:hypothetical protein
MKPKILFFAVILIFVIPQPASAYLDPSFGSMVWQMVIAVGFGVVFTFKIYWQKIKNYFSRTNVNEPQE